MKFAIQMILGMLFSITVYAHGDKAMNRDTSSMDKDKTVSHQYSPAEVQEKRSLKHKYVTRKDNLVSPTSPSNKKEWRAKAAMENNDTTNTDTYNDGTY